MGLTVNGPASRIFPIRWKLIIYFLIFMVLIIFVGLYGNLGLKMSARFFSGILDENKSLEEISGKVYAVQYYTENFLAEGTYSSLDKCLEADTELREEADRISENLNLVDDQEKYYHYLDLVNCFQSLINLSEMTVTARRNNQIDSAYEINTRLQEASNLTAKYLRSLMNLNTTRGSRHYKVISRQTKKVETLAYILTVLIALVSITFCIHFSLGITRPLEQMVQNAAEIASGNFKVEEVISESNDELQVITSVFNRMSRNIHDLFTAIQEKVALERQLKEEKMRNLEVTNLLRESEVQILQAQMNPHFLYNTLNAISQVAILEDASETGELIKAVARLLRYNLRSLDKPVTAKEEVDNIKEYIFIMGVRYGDRIECRLSIEGNLEKYLIPCMILQPLIENAYLHGAAVLTDRQGKIGVKITDEGSQLQIMITDNGVGIAPGKLKQVLTQEGKEIPMHKGSKRDSTGIGLANIQKRLRLFYDRDDLLTITSEPGQGTQVVLKLPMVEEDSRHAQFNDCG
ncbi:MAG: histidine kinase [Bacillota bacterium]